ncbi:unnamed protein product, partial [Trichogramma brassicae]
CQQPLRMEQPTGSRPRDSGNSEEEEGAGAMVDAKAEMPPSSIPCVVSSSTPTTTSSPAIYTAPPPTQSTPSTTPRVVSTWSSSTTTSSAPLTMGPIDGTNSGVGGTELKRTGQHLATNEAAGGHEFGGPSDQALHALRYSVFWRWNEDLA